MQGRWETEWGPGTKIEPGAGADLGLNTWGGHLVGVVSFNEYGDAEAKDFWEQKLFDS